MERRTTAGNGVPPAIRRTFEDIQAALQRRVWVKPFPKTPKKLGLRAERTLVVFTYNSYRKGWLDTRAQLVPELPWFGFEETHNKPEYWAAELSPERVEEIYRANRRDILAALSKWLDAEHR